ncbi:MAG: tripartite tricarboxylate transporter permease [Spirochaetaceae bacterium]|nr:tripartite tricarboxylate transporter permease [Spirochaetaceae bacterium]
MFENISTAITMIWSWQTITSMILGIIVGIIVGALPGLTTTMAVALFTPITFFMPPLVGITFLLGLYKGGMFGGSITAVLLATPGTAAAAATVADGYALAKQGKAGKAMKMALYGSVTGEIFGNFLLLFTAGAIASVALKFGPPELTAILLFSFTIIASLSGKSLSRGVFSAALGFFFAIIGIDPQYATRRFTMGLNFLDGGIPFVPALIGLFAMAEFLNFATERFSSKTIAMKIEKGEGNKVTLKEFKSVIPFLGIGSAVGMWIGILPAIGQPISCWLAYGTAKNRSKHPELFGKGSLEGIAAAESGTNAVNGPSLIPTLTLGIPGDSVTAILLGAFVAQGLRPGPLLFETQGPLVYALILTLIFGNIPFLIAGQLLIPLFARAATVSKTYLVPAVLALSIVGGFAVNNSITDLGLMLFFGLIGYFMKKTDIPASPMVIALILGKMTETAISQTLTLGRGSFGIMLRSPIALCFLIATALILLRIVYKEIKKLKAES